MFCNANDLMYEMGDAMNLGHPPREITDFTQYTDDQLEQLKDFFEGTNTLASDLQTYHEVMSITLSIPVARSSTFGSIFFQAVDPI